MEDGEVFGEVLWITRLKSGGVFLLKLLTDAGIIRSMIQNSLPATPVKDVYSRPNETLGLAPRIKGDKLTAMIKKLYAVVLLVSQEQGDREEYSIPLAQLVLRGNIDSKNTTLIRSYLEAMRRFSVTWNTRKGDEVEWRNTGLLKEVWITQGQGKTSMLYWELSKKIRERLIDPESFFTRLSLQMMTSLRSGSSISLYEICCQYASNDHNGEGGLTRRAGFEWWRPRLSGSLEDEHPQEYKYFKRDMLVPALKEINEITDITVELIEHRVGRRIEEIQFRVRKKDKPALPLLAVVATDVVLVERLMRLGLTRPAAEKLCRTGDTDLIARTATFTEKRLASGRAVASAAAYFTKALQERWVLAADMAEPQGLQPRKPVTIAERNGAGQGVRQRALAPTVAAPSAVDNMVSQSVAVLEAPPATTAPWLVNYEAYLQADEVAQQALLSAYKALPGNPFAQEVRKNGLFKKLVRVDFGQWLEGRLGPDAVK